MHIFNLFILLSLLSLSGFSQAPYPKGYFRSPLDIPLQLSGNFGEIRPNHFHTGLDLKTNGREGLNIYAIADGYVSRIKVSPFGYGKVLYITHPNGYVSAYAHLSSFKGAIDKYVKEAQQLNETFEIELFPNAETLPVKKGEVVALSGNTGGSQGPHLHFEIRDEKTENPINPLVFDFGIKDVIKPEILGLYLYPIDGNSRVDGSSNKRKYPLKGANGNYHLFTPAIISASGRVGFGIEAIDREVAGGNKNGVFSIVLKVDDNVTYLSEVECLSFEHNRAVNCHIDYQEKRNKGCSIQKCFVAENNQLPIYKQLQDKGIFNFSSKADHTVKYEVSDFFGNTSTLSFKVRSTPPAITEFPVKTTKGEFFLYSTLNTHKTEEIIVEFPEGIFYEDLFFDYFPTKELPTTLSRVHHLHNDMVPLNKPYTLYIKVDTVQNPLVKEKGVIAAVSATGRGVAENTSYSKGFLKTQTKNFGNYAVMLDTVAPAIVPVNISQGKTMSKSSGIHVKISDNLSGIKKFKGYIDGKWVLMEYEPKQALLYMKFDPGLPKGKHHFSLTVTDMKGNTKTFEADFVR